MLIAASCAACVAAFGTAAADATQTVRIKSRISIRSTGLRFSGRVSAANAACQGARKVTLHRKLSQVLGSTTTDGAGRWTITVSGSAGISLGRFYASVRQRSDGTAGTIYVCRAAKSQTIRLTP
ncbi:MAG: hypothetical protein NVSMB51_08020 [Solirubrobacteraceae bacterium]